MLHPLSARSTWTTLPPGVGVASTWPQPQKDLPSLEFRAERWTELGQLQQHRLAWQRLADVAADANPFYEADGMIAAWEYLRPAARVEILAIWGTPRVHAGGTPVLCGVFPLQFSRHHNGIPIRSAQLWRHDQCFLTTPLIRHDVLNEVWQKFWTLVRDDLHLGLIHFPMLGGNGLVRRSLVDWMDRHDFAHLIKRVYQRALLQHDLSGDDYLKNQIAKRTRNELNRLARKLEEQAETSTIVYEDDHDLNAWIERFLALERGGWKGEQATALACQQSSESFFRQWIPALAGAQKLQRLELRANDATIASKVNLVSGDHAFAFKIAFDSQWRAYSPGALLEVENIRNFHQSCRALEMDSCADPHHPMIDRLWSGRREIQSLLVATGLRMSHLALAAFPLLRWASRWSKRQPNQQPS